MYRHIFILYQYPTLVYIGGTFQEFISIIHFSEVRACFEILLKVIENRAMKRNPVIILMNDAKSSRFDIEHYFNHPHLFQPSNCFFPSLYSIHIPYPIDTLMPISQLLRPIYPDYNYPSTLSITVLKSASEVYISSSYQPLFALTNE